jgi:hypothetical protein
MYSDSLQLYVHISGYPSCNFQAQGDSAMADICRSDLDPEQVLPPSTASIELYEIRPL